MAMFSVAGNNGQVGKYLPHRAVILHRPLGQLVSRWVRGPREGGLVARNL